MPLEIIRPDARVAALDGLIDYAGLFPPTSLGMLDAVAEYRDARAGAHAWLVERFICPATRLEELATILVPSMFSGEAPWRIAAIGDGARDDWLDAVADDLALIRRFDEAMGGAAAVEVFERRVTADAAIHVAEAARRLGRVCFFEVSWSAGSREGTLQALAHARDASGRRLGAKIRCGGETADAFPPPDAVARFLRTCAALSLPVKATAGLHHPIRHVDAATGFTHHGFLNLLTAAAFAVVGADEGTLTEILDDTDAGSFRLDRSGMAWKGRRVDPASLATARGGLLVGYGSCSIDEPVDDLTALGILPVAA